MGRNHASSGLGVIRYRFEPLEPPLKALAWRTPRDPETGRTWLIVVVSDQLRGAEARAAARAAIRKLPKEDRPRFPSLVLPLFALLALTQSRPQIATGAALAAVLAATAVFLGVDPSPSQPPLAGPKPARTPTSAPPRTTPARPPSQGPARSSSPRPPSRTGAVSPVPAAPGIVPQPAPTAAPPAQPRPTPQPAPSTTPSAPPSAPGPTPAPSPSPTCLTVLVLRVCVQVHLLTSG